uniref:Putative baseplate protein n=1 Tax=viral metagenome TaxID=1070528 RepID=A0A6M3J7W5_9ZZZZ
MALPLTGYIATRLAQLIIDARAAIRAELGAGLLLENSAIGTFADVMMARLDELAEASQDLYDSFDERNASGVYLDNLCTLVGVTRIPAAYSLVTLSLGTGAGPVVVPAGSTVRDDQGQDWVLTAGVTIPALGAIDGIFSPPLPGPVTAAAATLDVPGTATIVTPIADWDTVTQAADAVPGRDVETDEELRLRRRESLQIIGSASVNAIRSALREIDGVGEAIVYENATDYPVTVGGVSIPGHQYLVIVYPDPALAALQQTIAESIWRRAPAGIASADASAVLGTTYTATVTDIEGIDQVVRFAVPDALALNPCTVTVVDGNLVADAVIKAAIIAVIDDLGIGEAPKLLPVYTALDAIPGINDVTALAFVGVPTALEKCTLAAIDIAVTHV